MKEMKTPKYRRTLRASRSAWADYRAQYGRKRVAAKLLTQPDGNLKFDRTNQAVYGLSFAQSRLSGRNVCPHSTPNCVAGCVGHNGNNGFPVTKQGQVIRTRFYFDHPEIFRFLVAHEIRSAVVKHGAGNVQFRMNVLSDMEWQDIAPEWFAIDGATFYDYTKNWDRVPKFDNYFLAYSATERTTTTQIAERVNAGSNVAVVLKVRGGRIRNTTQYRPIGDSFHGLPMVDADLEDDWSTRHAGVVGGLRSKGSKMMKFDMAKEVA